MTFKIHDSTAENDNLRLASRSNQAGYLHMYMTETTVEFSKYSQLISNSFCENEMAMLQMNILHKLVLQTEPRSWSYWFRCASKLRVI